MWSITINQEVLEKCLEHGILINDLVYLYLKSNSLLVGDLHMSSERLEFLREKGFLNRLNTPTDYGKDVASWVASDQVSKYTTQFEIF